MTVKKPGRVKRVLKVVALTAGILIVLLLVQPWLYFPPTAKLAWQVHTFLGGWAYEHDFAPLEIWHYQSAVTAAEHIPPPRVEYLIQSLYELANGYREAAVNVYRFDPDAALQDPSTSKWLCLIDDHCPTLSVWLHNRVSHRIDLYNRKREACYRRIISHSDQASPEMNVCYLIIANEYLNDKQPEIAEQILNDRIRRTGRMTGLYHSRTLEMLKRSIDLEETFTLHAEAERHLAPLMQRVKDGYGATSVDYLRLHLYAAKIYLEHGNKARARRFYRYYTEHITQCPDPMYLGDLSSVGFMDYNDAREACKELKTRLALSR